MAQGLHDSIWFLYKDSKVDYRCLLEAIEEAEDEVWEAKFKSKTAAVENAGIHDLKEKIDTLTTVIKSSSFQSGGQKPHSTQKCATPSKFQKKHRDSNPGTPKKSTGPVTSSAGSFTPRWKPYQCYKCGGWRHGFRNCPTPGNIDWRSLSRAEIPPESETPGPIEKLQDQQNEMVKGEGKHITILIHFIS